MNLISVLILFPLISAIIIFFIKNDNIRNKAVTFCAVITAALTLSVVFQNFRSGAAFSFENENVIDSLIILLEILLCVYMIYAGIKNKKYLVSIFAALQTPLILWFEFTQKEGIVIHSSIVFDKLTAIMVLIVGIVGSLICIYAVGYMKWYHHHHTDSVPRKNFFLAVLFLFLSAMFGLVLSNNLIWMYFFWEITSFCSYLLIGYTQSEEAKNNSFLALKINLGGGLAFAAAIVLIGINFKTLELSVLMRLKPEGLVLIPVFLLCVAAFTKSAQIPFSSWLFGAMVAPTPSSALLHSATMVKAGVYLIIRLSPLLGKTSVGRIVTLVGCITFLVTSIKACLQDDAKKILACSTIANLGLIVVCASIGTQESLWAAILLVIFHSIAKSLLFLCVGSAEHQLGSRNVENMEILIAMSSRLSLYMLIGISGMFLAPFGMLISKWVAMKAFIDSKNILTVIILAYGSAITMFYWTKWMGKLVSNVNSKGRHKHTFYADEEAPMIILTILVVVSCFTFPLISKFALIPYLTGLFGKGASIPIGTSDVTLMLVMLSMLIILPISFIPIHKNDKRRIAPVYMSGENTGDNETFYGAAGKTVKMELRNWYFEDYINNSKLTYWSNIAAVVILSVGVLLLIKGVVL